MKMIETGLISVAGMALLVMLAGSTASAQGTPDGETPAEEAVCDDLVGATPGLYGLCIAFCEAQDCDATLDAATGEVTFGPGCMPNAPVLLDNYNALARPGDPMMLCLTHVQGCPCWTQEELDTVDGRLFFCRETANFTFVSTFPFPGETGVEQALVRNGMVCQLRLSNPDPLLRFELVTPDEYDACRNSIAAQCVDLGMPLP